MPQTCNALLRRLPVQHRPAPHRHARHAALATGVAGLLVASIAAAPAAAQVTGVVRGTVSTAARVLPPLRITFDETACGRELPNEAILVDAAGRLANAVVSVTGVRTSRHTLSASVVNERCRFVPRVQVVGPAASVMTTSRDAVLHTTTAQTAGGRARFSVALPVKGLQISRPIGGAGIVQISCNMHPWMRAWIIATDEVAAVTNANGAFELPDLPAGSHELRVWHETLGTVVRKVSVNAGQATTVDITLGAR